MTANGDKASHTNICAGNGLYWDAGKENTGAFIGTTKPYSNREKYTCTYRYIK